MVAPTKSATAPRYPSTKGWTPTPINQKHDGPHERTHISDAKPT